MRGYGLRRAGAMRSLAAFYDARKPDVFAVVGIEAGDALAFATRFALQWAYRGGQALFWNGALRASLIRDDYLPYSPVRPFERRGLVQVQIDAFGSGCTLIATHVARSRERRIPELRRLRAVARAAQPKSLALLVLPAGRIDLGGLGFERAAPGGADGEALFARGMAIETVAAGRPLRGLGTPLVARLRASSES